jgi:hypothetical protein
MSELLGKAGTGTVAAIDARVTGVETGKVALTDTRYLAALTNAAAFATAAQGVLADGALQRSGGTMTGNIVMGTNKISGLVFGDDAASGATGENNCYIGQGVGSSASGDNNLYIGQQAGTESHGQSSVFAGSSAGFGAVATNSAYVGIKSGRTARGDNRIYVDVYPTDPNYSADGATNDMIFGDNGYLYLGRGGGAPSGLQGGTLRGIWTQSADREPYTIASSTNMIVDRANTDAQRIASILPGTSTIRFSAAVTNYASSIVLHVPPIGTNTIILPAGPVYSFGGGLEGLATTNYSTCFAESPVGSTNWAIVIWPGVAQ